MLDKGKRTGNQRRGLVAFAIEAGNADGFVDAALAASAAHKDDHINRLCDEIERRAACRFHGQLLEPGQRAVCGIGMQRRDAARMAGIPGLAQVKRIGAAHFADNETVWPQSER